MRPCGIYDETYGKDIAIIRTWQHWSILIVFILFLYFLPFITSYHILNFAIHMLINIIIVLGLQIVMGYCGQISLGQPAFVAIGAYASAIMTTHYGISFWVALPIGGIAAGAVGIIGGAPSLRIKGFYLAMSTIAMLFVTLFVITHLKITGGVGGISPLPPEIGNFKFDTDERMYYLILFIAIILTYFARNLTRSRIGRAFVAVRDNDLAAEVMGINIYYYKLLAFFISCFYAGIAGVLQAHWYMAVSPEQFTLMHGLIYIGAIIIGGMGSIPGVFFGVIFLGILEEVVLFGAPKIASMFPWIGTAPAASLGVTTFGLVMIVFLIFEPRGLAHTWEMFKASYRMYPFKY